MFETDTAILYTSDGKHSLPTWKKVGVCFVLIICFVSLYVTLSKFDFEKKLITQSFNDRGTTETFTFVPRREWDAYPHEKQVLTTQPASYVVISHTNTDTCSSLAKCREVILSTKKDQILKRHFDDIGYNFLIGNNQTYEARGLNVKPHDFFNYKNDSSFSIALIGNFTEKHPIDSQLKNLEKLIRFGMKNGRIDQNYTLLGHRQMRITDSPGQMLFDIIKKCDHWSEI